MSAEESIRTIDVQDIKSFSHKDPEGIAVIMPCTDTQAGLSTSRHLMRRADISCSILIIHDTIRQGFIKTLNQTFWRTTARYIVYLAQDAWPGRGWLKCAYDALENSGKSLLAFNDGKWQGRIASFGMVRSKWVKKLYQGNFFYPGYHSHAADNELTVIARALKEHLYHPQCTLVEYDPEKDDKRPDLGDIALFRKRFMKGFDGLVSWDKLRPLASEYKVNRRPGLSVIIPVTQAGCDLENIINSLLSAGLTAFTEIVFICNNNTSLPRNILAKYSRQIFIRYIQIQKNITAARACQYATARSSQSFLFFLSPIAMCDPEVLSESLKNFADQTDAPARIRLNNSHSRLFDPKNSGVLVPSHFLLSDSAIKPGCTSQADFFEAMQSLLSERQGIQTKPAASSDKQENLPAPLEKILFIIHDGSGGMVKINADLAKDISVLATAYILYAGSHSWNIYEYRDKKAVHAGRYDFSREWSLVNNIDEERQNALIDLNECLSPDLVHIRVLLGTGPGVIDFFKNRKIPVVLSFHEYSAVCPSLHLLNNGRFCSGDCSVFHDDVPDCRLSRKWFAKDKMLRPLLRNDWSSSVARSISLCDSYVVTSSLTRDIITKNYPQASPEKFRIIEHGRSFPQRYSYCREYRQDQPCDIFYYGALNESKGCLIVHDIIRINQARSGPFRFHILGNFFSRNDKKKFQTLHATHIYGSYDREELELHFKAVRPTLTILPSIWPETYSHALTESWAYGVPVLGSDLGAIGERIIRHKGGWTLTPEDPEAWFEAMLSIIKNKKEYRKTARQVQFIEIKTRAEMTRDYLDLYRDLLCPESGDFETASWGELNISTQNRLHSDESGQHCRRQDQSEALSVPEKLGRTYSVIAAYGSKTKNNDLSQGLSPASGLSPTLPSETRNPSVQSLRHKLNNLGFVQRAYQELGRLAADSYNQHLAGLAAWELALWHADRSTASDARSCLKYLQKFITGTEDLQDLKKATVLQAESFGILKDWENGNRAVNNALDISPDQELFLAATHLEHTAEKRLDWINKALELAGLEKIRCNYSARTFFEGLSPNIKPASFPDQRGRVEHPLISVIMPVYNAESTLPVALNSVLAQTCQNLEIIIVDDCSTDSTVEIVRRYQTDHQRIKLIQSSSNQGPYNARNIGLQAATGELVTCHDADDWSHPQKLELQYEALGNHPEAVASVSIWARMFDDLKFYRRGNPGYYSQINLSSLMFRRRIVMDRLGFWDNVRFGADTEFLKRIKICFGENAIIELPDKLLSFARVLPGSLTESSQTGYPGYNMGARKEYFESYTHHHKTSFELKYPFFETERPFPVPSIMLPDRDKSRVINVDIAWASDFRLLNIGLDRIKTFADLVNLGLSTALIPMYAYGHANRLHLHSRIRERIDGHNFIVGVCGEHISADILLVDSPLVLEDWQVYVPEVRPLKTLVLLDNLILKTSIETLENCCINLQNHFGSRGEWCPLDNKSRKQAENIVKNNFHALNLSMTNWDIQNIRKWMSTRSNS
ncbi:glycosyltransferase [Desulfonatronovibrio magnus]|uniref:glycosyltransferase n=1 Tax=Desulfonatronovibrio magnus TaxID=698827 RepID=UPI00069606EA|nr:glycosyltransferase [Desulfonatronovibrio magnus]